MSEILYNKEGAIERARALIGSPYLHQGDGANGIDCVNLLRIAFEYRGIIPPYPSDPVNGELERELRRIFGEPMLEAPILYTSLRPLDIVSMQYAGPVRHVAMVATHPAMPSELSLIHTDAMLEKVVEHGINEKWLRRSMRVWRP